MDPDHKRLLELAEENNRMLHKLLNDLRWRRFWGFIRWAVIIGSAIGLYYWFQPYIDTLVSVYTQGLGQLSELQGLFSNPPR